MNSYIKGKFRKSIFETESGYVIGIFKVEDTDLEEMKVYLGRTITFTGYFHELNEQDTYLFYGTLGIHPKYGEQFSVTAYERVMPEEKDAIVEFLTSGLFKGIGKTKAKKIVDVLGKATFDTILNNPSNLLLIPSITEKNIQLLHDKLEEYESSYQTIIELGNMGFTTKDSMALYNRYQAETKDVVCNHIYEIPYDFIKLPFPKIDGIALKNGYAKEDVNRIACGLMYIIKELMNSTGHCYFFKEELLQFFPRVLGIAAQETLFEEAVEVLMNEFRLTKYQSRYYLTDMFEAEKNIVKRFQTLSKMKPELLPKAERYLEDLESFFQVRYNDEQKLAILKSFEDHFLVITGGPGSGKTTILKAVCELYRMSHNLSNTKLQQDVALLALTGRAAKRLSEATLLSAETIHRFLKWNKETDRFALNEYHKSDVKMVIIDEASMLDTYLLDSLLKALRYDTKIILVGDYQQLPSVGPGQVLRDLIDSNQLNVVRLERLYRQKEDSHILSFAYDVREGLIKQEELKEFPDFSFLSCTSRSLKEKLLEICKQYQGTDLKNFQVLVPMYKTLNGIDRLNTLLQEVFNPKAQGKQELMANEAIYREGDKVIQLTNMPDENVFNGDIGFITKIQSGRHRSIMIDFDGNLVTYTPSNFANFKHGFAISIHKAQGSEVDTVVMPILSEYGKMLYRKLVYTGITRAKKRLYLLGEEKALFTAIANEHSDDRRTTILEFLVDGIKTES